MTPATGSPSAVMRLAAVPVDTRKKAHARLAERIDLARNRFKPLSILRAEAKRALEQFYDQEGTSLSRSDRDALIEDVLAESVGFGPLEEAFRDDAVKEILVVNAETVRGRKGDDWVPLPGRFRDDGQLRAVLARWAEVGEAYVAGPAGSGGFDVRLPNGFRAVGTLPPTALEVPPQAWLTRAAPAPLTNTPAPLTSGNGSSVSPLSGVYRGVYTTPAPRGSGAITAAPPRQLPAPAADGSDSGVISLDSLNAVPTYSGGNGGSLTGAYPASTTNGGAASRSQGGGPGAMTDPLAKLRQRITEKIIGKFAAAGMYDLNALPPAELGRIILAQVSEVIAVERLSYDEATAKRLTGEILASIKP